MRRLLDRPGFDRDARSATAGPAKGPVAWISPGLGTAALLVGNGLLVGLAVTTSLTAASPLLVAVALAPHELLEEPGPLLAGGVGLKSAQWCLATATGRPLPCLGHNCLVGALAAGLLIALAAPVEAHITPWVIALVQG